MNNALPLLGQLVHNAVNLYLAPVDTLGRLVQSISTSGENPFRQHHLLLAITLEKAFHPWSMPVERIFSRWVVLRHHHVWFSPRPFGRDGGDARSGVELVSPQHQAVFSGPR